jgi:hypothetical protein
MPDEALVVRGGRNEPGDIERGMGIHPCGVSGFQWNAPLAFRLMTWRSHFLTAGLALRQWELFERRAETSCGLLEGPLTTRLWLGWPRKPRVVF